MRNNISHGVNCLTLHPDASGAGPSLSNRGTFSGMIFYLQLKVDVLTAHRCLQSPWSLSRIFTHPNKGHPNVTIMVMNDRFPSQSFHVNRPSHSSDNTISNFDFENSDQTNNSCHTAIGKFDHEKSRVKVMDEIKCQGNIVDSVFNWCTSVSFYVNRTKHS